MKRKTFLSCFLASLLSLCAFTPKDVEYAKAIRSILKEKGEYKFSTTDPNKVSIVKDEAAKLDKSVNIEMKETSVGEKLYLIYVD